MNRIIYWLRRKWWRLQDWVAGRRAQFEVYLPQGHGKSGSINYCGVNLRGVSRCVVDVGADDFATITFVVHPRSARILIDSLMDVAANVNVIGEDVDG